MASDRGYTRGEILWLLQLDREGAIDYDAYPAIAINDGGEDPGRGSSQEDSQLFVIGRWWDVQRAKRRIHMTPLQEKVTFLRSVGFTEHDCEPLLKVSRSVIRRSFKATLAELMLQLGDLSPREERRQVVAMCLICGERPRCHLVAVRRRGPTGWRFSTAPDERERQAAVCSVCLAPDLRWRLKEASAA